MHPPATDPTGNADVFTCTLPAISLDTALRCAREHYGWQGEAQWLNGERDRNLLLHGSDGMRRVLKFINPAESAAATDLQIRALDWLQQHGCAVAVPQALRSRDGADTVLLPTTQGVLRVRAYTFVDGLTVAETTLTPTLQSDFGRTAAHMAQALAGFDHPALQRTLLWDVMHLSQLLPLAQQGLPEDDIKPLALRFVPWFATHILPQVRALPQQVIHSDLSRSNTVVQAQAPQHIVGVLDFGDLTQGPRVLELAIAASYALCEHRPALPALEHIIAGYRAVLPLTAAETALLPPLITARWLQRIIVSEWRAARFPHNRHYLMRSNAPARQLLRQLWPLWSAHLP